MFPEIVDIKIAVLPAITNFLISHQQILKSPSKMLLAVIFLLANNVFFISSYLLIGPINKCGIYIMNNVKLKKLFSGSYFPLYTSTKYEIICKV